MGTKVDFTGVKTSFEVLEEGIYPATFAGAKFESASKSSGKPYVQLEFDLMGEHEGRKAWSICSLQPQALWRLKKNLILLGAEEDALDGELDLEEEILPGLVGAECSLALVVEEFEGELRNKVSKVLDKDTAGVGSALPF